MFRYNSKTVDSDIALLMVNVTVDFSRDRKIAPICLPSPLVNYYGEFATAMGWGTTKNGGNKMSPVLLTVKTKVVSSESCYKEFGYKKADITENMICAETIYGSACSGDSGGPLAVQDKLTGRFTIVGIVSWSYKCNKVKFPVVYTHVLNFLQWILKHTRKTDYCKPLNMPKPKKSRKNKKKRHH
ncbi:trypsin alpha-3-like [Oratosquilla oratoria]|uniref:trypsin alpha-3-like n=1 Tax=Oratosquilla oratoria TaxID=337810 RepID=UPI003F7621AD